MPGVSELDLSDITVSEQLTKKDSEAFHAKALHIGLVFLPKDCPLNQYVCQTYKKNYLVPKAKHAEKEKQKQVKTSATKKSLLLNSGSKHELDPPVDPADPTLKPPVKKPIEKIKLHKSMLKLVPTPKVVGGPTQPASGLASRLNSGMKSVQLLTKLSAQQL